jgi:hypothetical protein
MSADEHLSPLQFSNDDRRQALKTAKSVPGREAPVFYPEYSHRYIPNPLADHRQESPLPGYRQEDAPYTSRTRLETLPLDRLESGQGWVSRTHLNNMARRKGEAPPIEVTHHTDSDRYSIEEGNHRTLVALKRGDTHIKAEVTHLTPYGAGR